MDKLVCPCGMGNCRGRNTVGRGHKNEGSKTMNSYQLAVSWAEDSG